jgi:hypothetical protein
MRIARWVGSGPVVDYEKYDQVYLVPRNGLLLELEFSEGGWYTSIRIRQTECESLILALEFVSCREVVIPDIDTDHCLAITTANLVDYDYDHPFPFEVLLWVADQIAVQFREKPDTSPGARRTSPFVENSLSRPPLHEWWNETDLISFLEVVPDIDYETGATQFVVERNGLFLRLSISPESRTVAFDIYQPSCPLSLFSLAIRDSQGLEYVNDQRGEYLVIGQGQNCPFNVRLWANDQLAVDIL